MKIDVINSSIKILALILLCSCADESTIIECFPDAKNAKLLVDLGPIEVDGCGWHIQTVEDEYYAVNLPTQSKIDSLYIFAPIEELDDQFTCYGGETFQHARLSYSHDNLRKIYWNETQCNDPWQRSANQLETLLAMKAYLMSQNIEVYSAKLVDLQTGWAYCAACSCGTGRYFMLYIHNDDLAKAEKLGFYNPSCDYGDPLTEIGWLKELKQTFDQSTQAAGARIIQYEYNDQCVFLIDDCYNCADGLLRVFDAEQNLLCEFGGIDGRNTCPDFYEKASKQVILYSNINP